MSKRRVRDLDVDRFHNKVSIGESCHNWIGLTDKDGYGIFYANNRKYMAHRYAWMISSPNPKAMDGMQVCHLCDNPTCVNIRHLFVGTQKDNMLDMIAKGRKVVRKGTEKSQAKLTETQVEYIKLSARSGKLLAEQFGVSQSLISMIRNGNRWKHVG